MAHRPATHQRRRTRARIRQAAPHVKCLRPPGESRLSGFEPGGTFDCALAVYIRSVLRKNYIIPKTGIRLLAPWGGHLAGPRRPCYQPGYPGTPVPAVAATGPPGAATTGGATHHRITTRFLITTLTPGSKPTRLKAKRKPSQPTLGTAKMTPLSVSHPALHSAKLRWAAAQQHHGLRGTPSHEMTRAMPTEDHLGAKPLGHSNAPEKP
jgi:hypothetical protein